MWKVLQIVSAVCVIHACAAFDIDSCSIPPECQSTTTEMLCTGITKFPSCVPPGITSLTVTHSPGLAYVGSIPSTLTYLSMSDTGVVEFDSSAIPNAQALRTLRITENGGLQTLEMGKPDSQPQLTTLYLANCTKLNNVAHLNKYTSLTSVTISYCNLRMIDDDMFEDLSRVKFLDISHNHRLVSIDEDAFEDLGSLEYLNMTDCYLTTLYGRYFDNAYHRNLKQVKALLNPYQCFEMCDFMEWFWKYKDFRQIGLIGTCTYVSGNTLYVDTVYDLGRYGAGCPPIVGIILGAVLGAFFLICLISCILVVACGIDYRKYFCCCCKTRRDQQSEEIRYSGNTGGDPTYEEVYNIHEGKTGVQLPGNMYTAAPPSYDALVYPDIQVPTDSITLQNPNFDSSMPQADGSTPDAASSTW